MNLHHSENLLVSVLIQLIVILLAARIAGYAARKIGQPRAVGEIVAGLILGPSLLGAIYPDISAAVFTGDAGVPMQVLSQIGLMLLMFQIGSEFDYSKLNEPGQKKSGTLIVVASVGVPLLAGYSLAWFARDIFAANIDRYLFSSFVAVAFAITAVPVLGRILREYNLERHEIGVLAISAAAANDMIGWVLLAAVSALATAQFSTVNFASQILSILALIFAMKNWGSRLVAALLQKWPVENKSLQPTLIAIVLVLIFATGICTQKLGLFTIFGGFLCGVLFHAERNFVEAWQRQVGQFVLVFFLPIFFTYTGLRTNILGLATAQDWAWCIGFAAAAMLAKIVPVYLAGRLTGITHHRSLVLGVLMNTRALMELIVLNVGFTLGFIPQNIFTMLVLMAVATTLMTGPLLRRLLPRMGVAGGAVRDA